MKKLDHPPAPLTLTRERLRAVIYGEYGRGKTTLALTAPRPLVIDTNGGLISVTLQGGTATTFEPEGYEDLEALYWWVKEHSDDYDTIVIDTLDSLVYALMDELTDDTVESKQASGRRVGLRMRFIPEQADYYASQRQMHRFLVALRQLGKHIIITSSLRDFGGRTAPNVSPGMERVVCDWASLIGELIILDDVDGTEAADASGEKPSAGGRVLLTKESNARATKSRFRTLVPYVVEPTFDKLWTLVQKEYGGNK
ncbi:MAG: AAA family ATPase [Thermoanaerobaculia bacterium]|jgi:hypothetical protein|nr:AAA family ATPase [bacterium]MCL4840107.1 AAA family ATPase [Thermoanaerobaculia bacterium]